jgi:hypothetical protein
VVSVLVVSDTVLVKLAEELVALESVLVVSVLVNVIEVTEVLV